MTAMLKNAKNSRLNSCLSLLVVTWSVTTNTTTAHAERFHVSGNVLHFDMGYRGSEQEYSRELEQTDVLPFLDILFENPVIDTVSVSGPGGYGPASEKIIEKILSLGLNTTAFGDCISACANIFLAGQSRALLPGARLGFHRPYIIKEEELAYFEAHRERMGWREEFDYVPWIYDIGLTDMVEAFSYMSSRGVSVDFITRAYSTNSFNVWFPTHIELEKNGVITFQIDDSQVDKE